MSKKEDVLNALQAALEEYFGEDGEWAGAQVLVGKREQVLPEAVPPGGYVVLFDGDPGEEDVANGFHDVGPYYYSHTAEIRIYVEGIDPDARNAAFDALAGGVGAVLDADKTLGGLAEGLRYGAPAPNTEYIFGGEDVKTAKILPVIDYLSPTRI